MARVIWLKENEVYFMAGFIDQEMTTPVIETWIYLGIDSKDGHIFQDVEDQTIQYCFPLEGEKSIESINNVYDRKSLSEWLIEDHDLSKLGIENEYRNL